MSKEQLEKEHSALMNKEAVERIKQEVLTQAQADRIEAVFFEDDEEIRLRDGKKYKIAPCSLKDARKLMKALKTVNVDVVIMNFVPSGDEEVDKQREEDLYMILEIAFKGYNLSREYLDEYVDVDIARRIVDILIGLNGLKK